MATGKKARRPANDPHFPDKEQIKDRLIAWLSEGKTLMDFCRVEVHPSFRTIYNWQAEDPVFDANIARARDIGHDAISEESLQLADKEPLAVFDEAGNKRYDPGSIAWRKMQIETRLKLLAKWNPKKYGDKTVLAGDPEAPLNVTVDFATFDAILTNMELLRHDGKPS
jgi:hypothetical protein